MKKIVLACVAMTFLLVGCGEGGNSGENTTTDDNPELKQEILTLDSTNAEMEKVAEEIEASSAELDAALNDL